VDESYVTIPQQDQDPSYPHRLCFVVAAQNALSEGKKSAADEPRILMESLAILWGLHNNTNESRTMARKLRRLTDPRGANPSSSASSSNNNNNSNKLPLIIGDVPGLSGVEHVESVAMVGRKKLKKSNDELAKAAALAANEDIFIEWFQSTLLPLLREPSVIILDSAKHHLGKYHELTAVKPEQLPKLYLIELICKAEMHKLASVSDRKAELEKEHILVLRDLFRKKVAECPPLVSKAKQQAAARCTCMELRLCCVDLGPDPCRGKGSPRGVPSWTRL